MRIVFIILFAIAMNCGACAEERVPADSCRRLVERIDRLSRRCPDSTVVLNTLHASFATLRRGEDLYYYVRACNIYVDWLYRHGRIADTQNEINRIVEVAVNSHDAETKAIAYRGEGQYLLRMGFYDAALKSFAKAVALCEPVDRLRDRTTYTSILLQLVRTNLLMGHADTADTWLHKLDMEQERLNAQAKEDWLNWLRVRINALHAAVEYRRGNIGLCRKWMGEAERYMFGHAPAKYYTTYYMARTDLLRHEHRYEECLAAVDSMVVADTDVLPLHADFLKQRAELLHLLGRDAEASDAYARYVAESDRTDRTIMAAQMQLMSHEYELQSMLRDKRAARLERIGAVVVLAILLALSLLLLRVYLVTRLKNRRLVALIMANDALRRASGAGRTAGDGAASGASGASAIDDDMMRLGRQGMEFVEKHHAFLDADGGRAALAAHLGVNERAASAAVSAAAGCSFKAYTNTLRLEMARRILKEQPDTTVQQVASQCGFGTLRTLQTLFKEKYGLTPSEYREY